MYEPEPEPVFAADPEPAYAPDPAYAPEPTYAPQPASAALASMDASFGGAGPQVDDSEVVVPNPFASARADYVAAREAEAAPTSGRHIPDVPIRHDSLPMPRPKTCLATASKGSSSGAAIQGNGLDQGAIRDSVRRFLPKVATCMPSGTKGTWSTLGEFTVGCDGVVETAELIETDDLPMPVVGCIEDALHYTPFPAHDRPGGEVFQMPMQFSG